MRWRGEIGSELLNGAGAGNTALAEHARRQLGAHVVTVLPYRPRCSIFLTTLRLWVSRPFILSPPPRSADFSLGEDSKCFE